LKKKRERVNPEEEDRVMQINTNLNGVKKEA